MRITGRSISLAVVLTLLNYGPAWADAAAPAAPYSQMAPLAQYRAASSSEEIALAQSAAPPSISRDAEVLIFSEHGYETAIKGKNGFVCLVERGWASGFDEPEFWNPKIRGPMCLNPAAARSVLPPYLERTEWVLAGSSKSEMLARTSAAVAANRLLLPEPGSMCYMLSKQGYLSDAGGHWHPHLMFFLAHTDGASWGADLEGSPVNAAHADPDPVTTFYVSVAKWSDGTLAGPAHPPG